MFSVLAEEGSSNQTPIPLDAQSRARYAAAASCFLANPRSDALGITDYRKELHGVARKSTATRDTFTEALAIRI